MTPADLRRIRTENAASQAAFARSLGYRDADAYRKYETGMRPIPPLLAKLAHMIDLHGMPEDWLSPDTLQHGADVIR